MRLTGYEQARLRGLWRALIQEGLRADVASLKGRTGDVLNWASPLTEPGDAFVLFALARMAVAYVRERSEAGRSQRRPALTALAILAGDVLDATDPGAPPPPPTLPFRADLDG